MKAVRLAEWMRDKIIERLTEHAFGQREADLKAQKIALGHDIYCDVYSAEIQALMASIPPGFMPERESIQVAFQDGENSSDYQHLPLAGPRRIPSKDCNRAVKVYPTGHPFIQRWDDLVKAKEKMRGERIESRKSARTILSSVTTLKRLIEVWPEIEPFTRDLAPTPAAPLPALPVQNLNALLGLPVSKP